MLSKKGMPASRRGRLFVISGPSGSGKTTLAKKLIEAKGKSLIIEKSISFSTRSPRSKERDKKDYFFISKKDFLDRKKNGDFIEWTKYLDAFYGTSKKYLDEKLKKSKNILLCLDVNGATALKKFYPNRTTTIFILPPSKEELKKRVEKRGKIDNEEFKARMLLAEKEKGYAKKYDYVLVNDVFSKTLDSLFNIIKKELRRS